MKDYYCKIKEMEFKHKKVMDLAYFFRDLGFMIFEKVAPFCLELLKVRIQSINRQKSWQNIINLKKTY